jgi:hypothetical protein
MGDTAYLRPKDIGAALSPKDSNDAINLEKRQFEGIK